MNKLARFFTTPLLLCTSLVFLNGCENSLVVKGSFPSPLVDKLPLTLGVHYEDEFQHFVYVEKSEDRSKWTIDSGDAQTLLFNTILPEMFEQVIEIKELPGQAEEQATEPDAGSTTGEGDEESANMSAESTVDRIRPDLILSPRIDEFQYAMPRETKVNVFEIWIKYNMRVYNADGQLIADWIMSSYGKTPTAFMKSKEEALNEAVLMALRDTGASLSLGFKRVPEIRAWLEQHNRTMLKDNKAKIKTVSRTH